MLKTPLISVVPLPAAVSSSDLAWPLWPEPAWPRFVPQDLGERLRGLGGVRLATATAFDGRAAEGTACLAEPSVINNLLLALTGPSFQRIA